MLDNFISMKQDNADKLNYDALKNRCDITFQHFQLFVQSYHSAVGVECTGMQKNVQWNVFVMNFI